MCEPFSIGISVQEYCVTSIIERAVHLYIVCICMRTYCSPFGSQEKTHMVPFWNSD